MNQKSTLVVSVTALFLDTLRNLLTDHRFAIEQAVDRGNPWSSAAAE